MQADLTTLKDRVLETTKASPVAAEVQDVELEPGSDDEGGDFLRVVIHLRHGEHTTDEDLLALIEAIEDAVGDIDERYPSVRFADAA